MRDLLTNRSANRPIEQSTDRPISQPTNQTSNRPTEQPTDGPTGQPTDTLRLRHVYETKKTASLKFDCSLSLLRRICAGSRLALEPVGRGGRELLSFFFPKPSCTYFALGNNSEPSLRQAKTKSHQPWKTITNTKLEMSACIRARTDACTNASKHRKKL